MLTAALIVFSLALLLVASALHGTVTDVISAEEYEKMKKDEFRYRNW